MPARPAQVDDLRRQIRQLQPNPQVCQAPSAAPVPHPPQAHPPLTPHSSHSPTYPQPPQVHASSASTPTSGQDLPGLQGPACPLPSQTIQPQSHTLPGPSYSSTSAPSPLDIQAPLSHLSTQTSQAQSHPPGPLASKSLHPMSVPGPPEQLSNADGQLGNAVWHSSHTAEHRPGSHSLDSTKHWGALALDCQAQVRNRITISYLKELLLLCCQIQMSVRF